MKENSIVFCYRYFFKLKDNDNLCFKTLCDVEEAHVSFMKRLCEDDDIVAASREYLYSVDCTKMCIVEPIKQNEKGGE